MTTFTYLSSSCRRTYRVCLAVCILLLMTLFPVVAPVHAQNASVITSPQTGSSVSGDIPILGTAVIEPFQKYELYFKLEPSGDDAYIWFAGGTQQVANGQLGVLQAGGLAPGVYSIRLRVVKNDGNYAEVFARDISVNQGPAATPTSDQPTETPIPTATFTPAPQPTPVVGAVTLPQAGNAPPAAPPTPEPVAVVAESAQEEAAPAAGVVVEPAVNDAAAEIESNSITRQLGEALNIQRLRTQFFNGVRYSAAIFLIVAVIFVGKRAFGWVRAQM